MKWPVSICQEIFGDRSLQKIIPYIKELGYEGIELAPFKIHPDIRMLDTQRKREIRDLMKNEDFKISACHWLLVSPPNLHITSPYSDQLKETREFFRSLIEFAAEVECQTLVFGSPNQRSIKPDWNYVEAYEQGVHFFQDMGDLAQKNGISLAFEPLGKEITNFGGDTVDAIELIETINHPNVRLHLDSSAMSRDSSSLSRQFALVEEKVRKRPDLVAYIHVNDPNQLGPGMGTLDFKPFFDFLTNIDYKGWISVETFAEESYAKEIAEKSIRYLQSTST